MDSKDTNMKSSNCNSDTPFEKLDTYKNMARKLKSTKKVKSF